MEVFILNYMPEAEKSMAAAGWATRSLKSAQEFSENVSADQVKEMITYSKRMKLSSVLNFPYYLFGFKNVSRSFTHQWVRYRLAAHMQQSLRYVKIKPDTQWFIIPPTILSSKSSTIIDYIKNQQESARKYLKLLSEEVPVEDARFVIPSGTSTHISTAMNAEELLHVFCQRQCTEAQWEIRKAAYALGTGLLLISPEIFDNMGPYCKQEGICRGGKDNACQPIAEKLVSKLKHVVDEKRDEFKSMNPGEELKVDLTPILGYQTNAQIKKEVEDELGWRPELDYEVKLNVVKR